MRRIFALIAAASLLATLTACSSGSADAACDRLARPGNASEAVTADGTLGVPPTVSFPTPLITPTVETSTLIAGSGAPLAVGQPVILEATITNGTTGEQLQQTSYAKGGGSLFTIGDESLPALGEALTCATAGSRIAMVASPEDSATPGSTVGADSLVYVIDVLEAFPSRADGAVQLPESGMPSVVTAPDGTPGITLPSEDAPTKFRSSLLRLGDGTKVAADSIVIAKLTSVSWTNRTVSQSSWATGSAEVLSLSGTDLSDGVRKAIEGKRVGSQVLAVIPPDLAGTASAPASDSLVYVIDILGIVSR